MTVTDKEVLALEKHAEEIRETIIEMLVAAGSGHTAGPLGMADIYAALYFHVLKHDPKNPDWEDRDRLILSNGHIVPVRYAAMAHAGYFPVEECLTLRKFGSRLQGHPERLRLPGLETTSGPLGEGLSQAGAIAYAWLMDEKTGGEAALEKRDAAEPRRVYVSMGDGEQDEGNVWEAVMWVAKNKLHNLTAIIDRNNIQIDGMTEDIMSLENLRAKYEAFNWHVIEVDGHNIRQFIEATDEAKAIYEKPTLIIAHTIPGKGVPEIEFDYKWHGIPPTAEQGKRFLKELRTLNSKLPNEYS
ncbi:MAG: transketolase [Candidatus Pacebacteria bacterium]|nr:transketolase [Candidatus Paceibacterota bacterium]